MFKSSGGCDFHRWMPRLAYLPALPTGAYPLVGVGICGRPVSRHMQDGGTVEVVRCCVVDGAPKGTPSAIYGALWRAARALGWTRMITYTLQSESGASLRGAGWRVIAERVPRDPAGWQSRPGREWQAVVGQSKLLWEASRA